MNRSKLGQKMNISTHIKNLCLGSGVVIVLSGCASMSVEQCKTANWYQIGEKEGASGSGSSLDRHYKACQKAQIVPNQSQYEQGFAKGLSYYCTPRTVFDYALQGRGNYEYCPIQQRASLRPYYQTANQYYQAKKVFQETEDKWTSARQKLLESGLKEKDRTYYKKLMQDGYDRLPQLRRDLDFAEQQLLDFKYRQNFY